EAPIEAPAEPVVEEVSTEALTEPVAEELTTEAPTEPASEEPTETPTESWTEEPTTEALTEPVTEEPTEPPTEAVSEPFTESISEGSSESQDNTDQLSSEKKDLSITLAVVSELGQNQLKIEEDSQDFAEALFSEEERMRGGHGTVRISADSAEELLKEEAEKSDDQKLTQEERSAIEAEQEVLTQWIAENGYTAGQSFVLRLKKGLDGEGWTRVYESAESLRMILELSDVPAEAEEAILIFVQNGQIIICTDLDTAISRISFEGRTFGTYAVAYRLCQEDSQTENGAAIERESETKDEGASGQEAESESELQSESESEAGTEPELPSEPEPESETEPEILNESETESETELEPELEPESTCAEIEISVSAEAVVYQPGTTGTWNPHTHCYEGGTAGGWIYADGSNEVLLTNHSEQDVTLILSYQSLQEYGEITGSFTDLNGEEICEVTIPAGEAVTVLVVLDGKPDTALLSESIGEITYEQIEEEA
ncbi:MAG: hypothetical protein Q4F41_16610, partial [Eubacteriales bacterium]|nr:hypothetical protein [Eubacteriales bacterium]